jgi:hypothetical protein
VVEKAMTVKFIPVKVVEVTLTRLSPSRQCPWLTEGKQIGFGNVKIAVKFGEAVSMMQRIWKKYPSQQKRGLIRLQS